MADKSTPDPIAEKLAELDRLIEQQKARLAAMSANAGGDMSALERILEKQDERQREMLEAQKEIAVANRPTRHSNPDHLHISAFSHPEGDLKRPKPKFIPGKSGRPREVWFNNGLVREEDLMPAEIEAYNLITHSCEARDGRWTAVVKANAVYIEVPSFTADDRMDLPNGLVLILRELAQGTKAVDPAEMAIRMAALERQIADMQTGVVVVPG